MTPNRRVAGITGVLAGIGLAAEFACFSISGWSTAGTDPSATLAALHASGGVLRLAGFVGVLNLALAVIFLAGLAAILSQSAPTFAAATLYFGLIGIACHALVPIGLRLGIPVVEGLAGANRNVAIAAWGGFGLFMNAAASAGYFFDGLSVLAAGWAMQSLAAASRIAGWMGVLAGATAVLNVLTGGTALGSVASATFAPGVLLTIGFRTSAGYALLREARAS